MKMPDFLESRRTNYESFNVREISMDETSNYRPVTTSNSYDIRTKIGLPESKVVGTPYVEYHQFGNKNTEVGEMPGGFSDTNVSWFDQTVTPAGPIPHPLGTPDSVWVGHIPGPAVDYDSTNSSVSVGALSSSFYVEVQTKHWPNDSIRCPIHMPLLFNALDESAFIVNEWPVTQQTGYVKGSDIFVGAVPDEAFSHQMRAIAQSKLVLYPQDDVPVENFIKVLRDRPYLMKRAVLDARSKFNNKSIPL